MDQLLHYIVQLDEYLAQAVQALGPWAYGAIFLTIFCETGLVVLPFLPGESLLLTSGTLAGAGVLNIVVLWPLLVGAAFLGDVVNYLIGRWLGKHLLSKPRKHLKPKHVQEAQEFYEEHGGLAIVACRFLPIVRTLVPFVAGVTKMEFHRYLFFAFIAAVVWVTIFLGAGYLFGNVRGCRTTSRSRWRSPSPPRPSRASSSGPCTTCAGSAGRRTGGWARIRRRTREFPQSAVVSRGTVLTVAGYLWTGDQGSH